VNVALAPLLTGLAVLATYSGWTETMPNAYTFFRAICFINFVILFFNLLPIYPLDGGQILRSVLWFAMGRARSLMVATMVGFVGVAGLIVLAVISRDVWFGVVCVFILLNCWGGLLQARVLARLAKLPRRDGFVCPACKRTPVIGPFWRCDNCLKAFDTFESGAICPHCGKQFPTTRCVDCGSAHPINEWSSPSAVPVPPKL
jgi:hypothetical protein